MREAAGTLKRVSLELGGKSPNIVFADADIEAAVKGALTGIFYNKGEVCAAGSRLFLEQTDPRRLHGEAHRSRQRRSAVGDPMDQGDAYGGQSCRSSRWRPCSYIDAGKKEGAHLRSPAAWRDERSASGKGYFVEPTIFDGVTNTDEDRAGEIFGPCPLRDPVQVD